MLIDGTSVGAELAKPKVRKGDGSMLRKPGAKAAAGKPRYDFVYQDPKLTPINAGVGTQGGVVYSGEGLPASSSGGSSGGGGSRRRSSGGGGGGGGGGGASAAAVAPQIVLPDLSTYISQSALLKGAESEGDRQLSDFDSQTKQQRSDTDADMKKRRGYLDDSLEEAGTNNAESFASRGLGRSGLVLKAQQDIDEQGEQQKDSINQLMTNLLTSRAAGRLQQVAQNRTNRQNAISQLTQTYNTLLGNPNVTTAS